MVKILFRLAALTLLLGVTIACQKKEIDTPNPSPNKEVGNANTAVTKYNGSFLYGFNMAYKNGSWKDEDIADILVKGIGSNSLRPALYEGFVEKYGYSIRLDAFNHYKSIGSASNTVFIGDRPSDEHREKKQYAAGLASESYENLYEPIWDNGENGTPVNDNNYYALYVYKLVKTYGGSVRFWEIKNEPDYTYTKYGNSKQGDEGNWWDNDPNPEHLKNLRAPIQSYVRMLRVSYEVIKHVDSDAYVCVGGIGYSSFLDAILRNTDNPDGGKVTDKYPLKGGAWFDCLSYHSYPMYYLRSWTGNAPGSINGFTYFRNSDAAAKSVIDKKTEMFDLMKKYGYGTSLPLKEAIITETNIPHKQLDDHIGSQEAQRNFAIKVAILCQQNDISGVYIYCPWDNKEAGDAGNAYDFMGAYRPIPESPGQQLRLNEAGTAWKTMTSLLTDSKYSKAETDRLNLPSSVMGGAFLSSKTNDYIYVLWAKTEGDLTENASASYTFPQSLSVNNIYYKQWDNKTFSIADSKIQLTGSPVFIKLNKEF